MEKILEKATLHHVGYHMANIPKGQIGTISKIKEEVLELEDSANQTCKIMSLVELSDLYGAIQLYLEHNFPDFTIKDLEIMSNITRRAFENGQRI